MSTTVLSTPTKEQPAAQQVTILEGTDYTLDFDWIERAGCWSLSLSSAEGKRLQAGILLLPGTDLFETLAAQGRPKGSLVVRSKNGNVPDLETLSTETELLYITLPGSEG